MSIVDRDAPKRSTGTDRAIERVEIDDEALRQAAWKRVLDAAERSLAFDYEDFDCRR